MTTATAKELNNLLAQLNHQYFLLKYYHWNFTGYMFYQYHLLFDEFAGKVFNSLDEIAERIRQLESNVDLVTLKSGELAEKIQLTPTDEKNLDQILNTLLQANHTSISLMEKIIDLASKNNDYSTADILTKYLEEQQKYQWFLKSSQKKGE